MSDSSPANSAHPQGERLSFPGRKRRLASSHQACCPCGCPTSTSSASLQGPLAPTPGESISLCSTLLLPTPLLPMRLCKPWEPACLKPAFFVCFFFSLLLGTAFNWIISLTQFPTWLHKPSSSSVGGRGQDTSRNTPMTTQGRRRAPMPEPMLSTCWKEMSLGGSLPSKRCPQPDGTAFTCELALVGEPTGGAGEEERATKPACLP